MSSTADSPMASAKFIELAKPRKPRTAAIAASTELRDACSTRPLCTDSMPYACTVRAPYKRREHALGTDGRGLAVERVQPRALGRNSRTATTYTGTTAKKASAIRQSRLANPATVTITVTRAANTFAASRIEVVIRSTSSVTRDATSPAPAASSRAESIRRALSITSSRRSAQTSAPSRDTR